MLLTRSRYPLAALMVALALLAGTVVSEPPKEGKPRSPRGDAAEKQRMPAPERMPGEGPAAAIEELRAVESELRDAGNTTAADRISAVVERMERRMMGGGPPPPGGPEGFAPPPGGPGSFGPPPGGPGGRPRESAWGGPPVPMGAEAIPAPIRESFKQARASEEQIARLEKKIENTKAEKPEDVAALEAQLAEQRTAHKEALAELNAQAPELKGAVVELRERLQRLTRATGGDQAPRPRLNDAIERLGKLGEVAEKTQPGDSPELYKMLREQSNFLQRTRVETMPGDASGHTGRMRNEMLALRERMDRLQRELDTLEGAPAEAPAASPMQPGEEPLPPLN